MLAYSGAGAAQRSTAAVIGITGSSLGLLATLALPFVSFRPNRIVDGTAATAIEAFGPWGWILTIGWLALGALTLMPLGRFGGLTRGVSASVVLAIGVGASGCAAIDYAATQGSVARTSFSVAFYLSLLGAFLVLYAAAGQTPYRIGRLVIWTAPVLLLATLAASGVLAELGIVREWAFAKATFAREFRRHMAYALGATAGAVALGIPFGILSARDRRAETIVMGALNLGQVFPALAFVGLMMPILGALGDRVALFDAIGISGIGWAPVFIVLLVYALFPITRNTLVAIRQIDPAVLDTARGMGMGRWRSLAEVELPLAFPVVLAGIRIALVQSTAGAIIAAFVGGGGLGTIMFFGLEQTSMDLVLVGVLPIVALALVFDAGLRAVERMAGGSGEAYA